MFLPVPGLDALWLLLICLSLGVSLIGLGLPLTSAQTRVFAPWAGWGILSGLMVVWGTLFSLPLSWLLMPLLAIGFLWAVWNVKRLNWWLYPLIAGLILLLFGSMAEVVMWDDFSHRLGSVLFIYEQDAFPRLGLPTSPSGMPAYPYGLSFIGQAASLLSGQYEETALAVFGGVQFVFLAALVMWLWRPNFQHMRPLFALFLAAGAFAFTTWGNPLFVPKLVFSGYNDVPIGLFLAAALVVATRLNHALYQQEEPWEYALLLGAIGVGIAMQKQVGFLVFAFLGLAFVWPHLWRKTWQQRDFWLVGLLAGGLPLLLTLIWRWYISVEIPDGEFGFKGISNFHWDKIPDILSGMGRNIWHAPGLFAPQMIVLGLAAYGWRRRFQTPHLQESIRLAAWLAIAYNLFMFAAYFMNFSAYEAVRAASYDRYNMHVSYACWVVVLFAAGAGLQRFVVARPYVFGVLACVLAWGLPVALAERTLIQAAPASKQIRQLGQQLRPHIGEDDRILIYAPQDSGYINVTLRYELGFKGTNAQQHVHHFRPIPDGMTLKEMIAKHKIDKLVVIQHDDALRQAFPQFKPGQVIVHDVRSIR